MCSVLFELMGRLVQVVNGRLRNFLERQFHVAPLRGHDDRSESLGHRVRLFSTEPLVLRQCRTPAESFIDNSFLLSWDLESDTLQLRHG